MITDAKIPLKYYHTEWSDLFKNNHNQTLFQKCKDVLMFEKSTNVIHLLTFWSG